MPTTLAADQRFIVDRRLGAVRVDQLLDVRAQLRLEGRIDRPVPPGADRAVLNGRQSLAAGVVYPSERVETRGFYLPKYQIAIENGKPLVELRVEPAGGDAFGTLSVTLTLTAPAAVAPRLELRAIDHQVALAIRSLVPVDNKPTPGVAPAPTPATFEHRIALQPPVAIEGQRVRSVTRIPDRALFDSLYQAMRSPDQQATLELQISARVGVKTWNQVLLGRPGAIDAVKIDRRNDGAVFTEMLKVERAVFSSSQTATRVRMAKPVAAAPVAADSMRMQAVHATRPLAGEIAFQPNALRMTDGQTLAQPRVADTPVLRPVRPHVADSLELRPVQPRVAADANFARIETPALRRVIDESDLQIDGRRVVPIRVALDEQMRPAVIDADMKCRQSLLFFFDPAQPLNVGVYVAEGYAPSIHLLQPIPLYKNGSQIDVVYQDNLLLDVVHVKPTQFRLQRDTSAPHLPNLSFVAGDFATDVTDTEADVLYRVSMVYRLQPWLDEEIFQLARAALPNQKQLRFTTTIPPGAKLTLNLPDGAVVRKDARIDVHGVDDVVELDDKDFEELVSLRLRPPGSEISGHVDYELPGRTLASVPVRMSLHDDSADLFDVAFLGPVAGQPSRLRVELRNRIESPVKIVELPGEVLTGGGIARPVDPATVIGKELKPQEKLQVDYDIGDAPAPADFDPSVIGRPQTDLEALLSGLIMTPDYASRSFKVQLVATEESFRAAPDSRGAITGLMVEFGDGTHATLTPQELRKEVTLLGRIVDRLLGRGADSKRYLYRVTNLHAGAEGARSNWDLGEGGGELRITAVQSNVGL